MFSVDFDAGTGIIRCASGGFKAAADVEAHSKAVHEAIQRSYRCIGRVFMLVIVGDGAVVQTTDVIETAKKQMQRFRAADRVAIVVSRQLVKLQAVRTLSSDRFKIFGFESEAKAWLASERAVPQGAGVRSAAA
jgi:hypothetical protein